LLERVRVRQGEGAVPQDMTANQIRIKRKRGGQKGNGNARKHGFYSAALSPAETSQLLDIVNLEGVDPEVALIRVKLQSSLQHDPGNRRVIREASRLVVKWYSENYGLDATTGSYLKSVVQDLLETASIRPPNAYPPSQDKRELEGVTRNIRCKDKWQTTKRIERTLTI
jgi:hypothetical protein